MDETTETIAAQLSRLDTLADRGQISDGQYLAISNRLMEKYHKVAEFPEFMRLYKKIFRHLFKYRVIIENVIKFNYNQQHPKLESLIDIIFDKTEEHYKTDDMYKVFYELAQEEIKEGRAQEHDDTVLGVLKWLYFETKRTLREIKTTREINLYCADDLDDPETKAACATKVLQSGILTELLTLDKDEDYL